MKTNTKNVLLMLVFVAVSFVLGYFVKEETSTNKNLKNPIPNATENINCDSDLYKRLVKEYSYEEQLKWLKTNNKWVCNTNFYGCIEDLHNICDHSFEKLAKNHPENQNGIVYYYDLKKDKLKTNIDDQKFSNCYEKQVSFNLVRSTDSSVPNSVAINFEDYTNAKSCYSIPLFLGIFDKYKSNTNLIFRFCKAKVGTNVNATIFQVIGDKNEILGSYDISDDPKK